MGTPTERKGLRLEALRERQSPKVAWKDAEEIERSKVDRHGQARYSASWMIVRE